MKSRHLALLFSALTLTPAASTQQLEKPVALLATGTNSGTDVRHETEAMITRLQDSGYRVVVIPPRNAANARPGLDLRPLYRAVTTAATARNAEVLEAQRWDADGFHIHMTEAQRIGRLYPNAATFGDSNSVRINFGTGGHCMGVSGMTTTEILQTQQAPAANAPRQECRRLRDFAGQLPSRRP